MSRPFALTAVKAGISRLTEKGSPNKDSLWDLFNADVNAARKPCIRRGTVTDTVLPAGTKGIVSFQGKLVVFASELVVMTDPDYVCQVIPHPTDTSLDIEDVPFAAALLNVLYAVVRFENGDVFHYWLRSFPGWTAGQAFLIGGLVQPTTPNGYLYRAARLSGPRAVWAPRVARALSAEVEPTVYNGYYATVTAVYGPAPASGTVEPTWPVIKGAEVAEVSDGASTPTNPTTPGEPPSNDGGAGDGTGYYTDLGRAGSAR